MLKDLISIIELINKGDIRSAAKKVIELSKYANEEEKLEIVAEIERELKDLESNLMNIDIDFPFNEDLTNSFKELNACREKVLKFLIIYAIYKLSNGNSLLMNMINKIEIKPHTFF